MFKKNDYFILFAAFGSLAYSVVRWFGVLGPSNKETGLFVGLWVPSILALGCFAKLSMREKSDG